MSRGPGEASEWYWMLMTGRDLWRRPSTVPSVEVQVAHLDLRRQALGVHGVAVVLGGDVHLVGVQVSHRVVCAAVSELELEGAGAKGAPKHLVAQADAHYGHPADETPGSLDGVVQKLWVAGPRR